jgi:hypothetical protein
MTPDEGERRLRWERTVPLNVPIPFPLRERLDGLLKRLDLAGASDATLKELIAVLCLNAEEDKDKLFTMLIEYRNVPPEAASLAGEDTAEVLQFRRRGQGRPRKKNP